MSAGRKIKIEKVDQKGKKEMDQVLAPSSYRLTDKAYVELFFKYLKDIREELEVLHENAESVKAAQAMGGVVTHKTTRFSGEGNSGKTYKLWKNLQNTESHL